MLQVCDDLKEYWDSRQTVHNDLISLTPTVRSKVRGSHLALFRQKGPCGRVPRMQKLTSLNPLVGAKGRQTFPRFQPRSRSAAHALPADRLLPVYACLIFPFLVH